MNVYDFDHTLYRGDSAVDFYRHCLRRRPALLRWLPRQAGGVLRYLLGLCGKDEAKTAFFSFLRGVRDLPAEVARFWAAAERRLAPWYPARRQAGDVVVSASPAWLLQPICDRLNVALVATDVDAATGALRGPNCHGAQKVARFRAAYPDARIDAFYSDSLSDAPMARLAAQAYLVRGQRVTPWPAHARGR